MRSSSGGDHGNAKERATRPFNRIMKIVTDTQKLDRWNGDTTTLTVTQF
jgi:hypothetical protein